MKFNFQDDEKEFLSQQQNTRFQDDSRITINNETSGIMYRSINPGNLSMMRQLQIKDRLTLAVNTFKQEIDKEMKAQIILKKEIQLLNGQEQKIKQRQKQRQKAMIAVNIKKNQKTVIALVNTNEKQCVEQFNNRMPQIQQKEEITEVKQPIKVIKPSQTKSRSIKSELLSKGFPVNPKNQGKNNNQIPYRFR